MVLKVLTGNIHKINYYSEKTTAPHFPKQLHEKCI